MGTSLPLQVSLPREDWFPLALTPALLTSERAPQTVTDQFAIGSYEAMIEYAARPLPYEVHVFEHIFAAILLLMLCLFFRWDNRRPAVRGTSSEISIFDASNVTCAWGGVGGVGGYIFLFQVLY